MSRPAKAALILLLLGNCAPKPAAHLEDVSAAGLDAKLAAAKTPGIVFGAVWRDGDRLVRAAGFADLAARRKTTAGTPFAWFSVTKLFTATAVLQLSERGLVDLDAPVSRYLPQMHLVRDGREATVRQLLSHTAGLSNPVPVSWIHLADESGPMLDAMIAERIGPRPRLDFVPGTRTAYSNLGYLLLGKIVERVSGMPYKRHVEASVLAPLGCKRSGFAVSKDRATGYQEKWSFNGLAARFMVDGRFIGETVDGSWALRPFTVDGAPYGGLNGPADCLLHFARMILKDGEGENGRVLATSSVHAMLKPAPLRDGKPSAFGLAWRLGTIDGEPYAEHEGGGGGFHAELRLYPRKGYAVAVLANETSAPVGELAGLILRRKPADRR